MVKRQGEHGDVDERSGASMAVASMVWTVARGCSPRSDAAIAATECGFTSDTVTVAVGCCSRILRDN